MSQAPLNVALVGCGKFGEVHAATYAAYERANLLAVCDIDAARAEDFARRFGARACTSVEELAADESVRAVSVATPDFAHRAVCEVLAAAGKHLLIEKPLATTVADAEAIARAVREAGVTAMVDFHNRYQPALGTLRARLEAGELGRPQAMFARLSDRIEVATEWFAWSGRSGPEWFLGSHLADVACWLFDADPHRVYAEGRRDVLAARGIDCHDTLHIHLSFPAGFATLETSWILPNHWPMICDFYVSLQATAGRAEMDMSHQGLTVVSDGAAGRGYERPLLAGMVPVGEETFGFMPLPIRHFVRTVLEGRPSPLPVEVGVANVRILEAAVESARTGRPVETGL